MASSSSTRRELPEFTRAEFERRAERARRLMTRAKLDALLVTAEANVEYLSGFTTQFAWNTPTRPWYFVLPRVGKPVGVIPEIGVSNWLATSWVENVLAWPSPRPDDEGLGLLRGVFSSISRRYGRIGMELGAESRIGMPVADVHRLEKMLARSFELVDGFSVTRSLRVVKSSAEVARIRRICQIASDSFAALPGLVAAGDTERLLVRKFQADLLSRGADKTPYTAIGSGRGGYDSIIVGPTRRKLRKGDIFLIDTGARYAGYFCDFDRNYAIGAEPTDEVKRVQAALYKATGAGIRAATPGNTAADVFHAQARVLGDAGFDLGNVGRFGHGLGKVLTEPPSNMPGDATRLVPGMVLTIEPNAMYGNGKMLVHEENLVVTEDRPKLLSRRASPEITVIDL